MRFWLRMWLLTGEGVGECRTKVSKRLEWRRVRRAPMQVTFDKELEKQRRRDKRRQMLLRLHRHPITRKVV